jgi:hypothetical protein
VNGVVPWSEDVPGRTALIPRRSRGPGFSLPREAALDDAMPVPKAFDIVDLGTKKLGLPGYPRAPLLPANWWQVVGGGELTCLWVTIVHRLLKETLTMVGRDVLQPVWVNP